MKRRLKTFLILVAIFLLPMLWLLFSHLLAKSALDQYKTQLRAAGERLTIDELLPPHVPPEKNGAQLIFQAYPNLNAGGAIDSNPPPAMQRVAPGKAMIGWQQPYIVSQDENRTITNTWSDIEQELRQYGPGLDLVQQAAARPCLDFGLPTPGLPTAWTSSLATQWSRMKWVVLVLAAATVSDLNRGQTSAAVTNIHTALTLVSEWKDEPSYISQQLRFSFASIVSRVQWELLQATNLTDPELALLQHDWESMDLIRPMESALEMMRVSEIRNVRDLRTSNSPSATVVATSPKSSGDPLLDFIRNLGRAASRKTSDTIWRSAWSYRDELWLLQCGQADIDSLRQAETNGFFKDALAERERKIKMLSIDGGITNWIRNSLNDKLEIRFGSTPGSSGNAEDKTMSAEATRRIVVTAIALKRFQLQHGTWPADLKTLVPDFLPKVPRDPVDGLPLRYHPNADGSFTLYSIGDDQIDNGGDPWPSGSNLYWLRGHDWVWPQPATPEEIQQYYTNLQHRTSVYK